MKYLAYILLIIIIIIVYKNYHKIPSKEDHINRNKYNVFPVGKLRHIKGNRYIDNAGVIWIKRTFIKSLLHNPFKYYEVYDENGVLKKTYFLDNLPSKLPEGYTKKIKQYDGCPAHTKPKKSVDAFDF
jgi:hypothetical protein